MKATENLALLQKIANSFEKIRSKNDVEKEFLDDILLFSKIDESIVYQDLLDKQNLKILLKEFQVLIFEIEDNLFLTHDFFDEDSIRYLFRSLLAPFQFKHKLAYDEIRPYSKKKDELEKGLDNYYKAKEELIIIEKDLEIVKKEYKIYQKKLNDAYDNERKAFNSNSYILSFKLSDFVKKLKVLKSNIARLSNSDAFSQDVFKDENAIELAYKILVKMGFLKMISRPDFYNQISLNTSFSLEKNKSKDKYIAYAINKLKDYIIDNKKEIWESEIIKGFGIQNYDKVKTVKKSELRKAEHKQIDLLIFNYLEDSKSS